MIRSGKCPLTQIINQLGDYDYYGDHHDRRLVVGYYKINTIC